jgi:hypothetical protein
MNDGVGIGDFALSLLEKEKLDPTPASRNPTSRGDMIDIEHVQVIQEEVDQVLSDAFGFETKEKPRVNSVDERRKQLKEEIKQKVTELKSLLNEYAVGVGTTSTGAGIGIPNFSGGKKSNGPNRNRKKSKKRARARRKSSR